MPKFKAGVFMRGKSISCIFEKAVVITVKENLT
jgi:hypothetical protein